MREIISALANARTSSLDQCSYALVFSIAHRSLDSQRHEQWSSSACSQQRPHLIDGEEEWCLRPKRHALQLGISVWNRQQTTGLVDQENEFEQHVEGTTCRNGTPVNAATAVIFLDQCL